MPRMAASTAAASRMSPLTNSISRSTSRSRRKDPRELSSNTRTASPSRTSALNRPQARNALPAVTRIRRGLIRPPVLRLPPPADSTSGARTGNRYRPRTNARKCARLFPGRPPATSARSRPPREDFLMSVVSYRLAAIGLACALVTPASAQLLARKDVSAAMALTIAPTAIATCAANGYRVSATAVGRRRPQRRGAGPDPRRRHRPAHHGEQLQEGLHGAHVPHSLGRDGRAAEEESANGRAVSHRLHHRARRAADHDRRGGDRRGRCLR